MTKIKFTPTILKALEIALDKNMPFAMYIFPNAEDVHFFASAEVGYAKGTELSPNNDWRGLAIDLFHPESERPIKIPAQMSAKELIAKEESIRRLPKSGCCPIMKSTSPALYLSQITKFVDELNRKDTELKKAVLCRVVAGFGRNIVPVMKEYFSALPNTFRYLYYTPVTGMWLGASPELLLDQDFKSNRLSTMSLAGTRRDHDESQPWSDKNLREHDIVTGYIASAMTQHGLTPEISELYERKFSSVVHLCNDIKAECTPDLDVAKLLRSLSPTPALCGYPKLSARKLIENTEAFDRLCYGGWVAVKDDCGVHAYVNLRCACVHLATKVFSHYCVYTGGGIMPDSNFEDEWHETANKANLLCSMISTPDGFDFIKALTDCTLTINPEFNGK